MSPLIDGLAIVRADGVAPQPWKNGGGVTRELLRLPLFPGAAGGASDDWLLRISLADIEADGPFSAFEGIVRWFTVLSGHGVALRWPHADNHAEQTMTVRSAPLEFDGATAPDCRLVDGPTRDLNVMVRDTAAKATLVRAALWVPMSAAADDAFGVFTLRPLRLERDGESIALPAHTLAWHDGADKAAWSLSLPDDAYETIAQTAEGAPPAYWIGLQRRRASPT